MHLIETSIFISEAGESNILSTKKDEKARGLDSIPTREPQSLWEI